MVVAAPQPPTGAELGPQAQSVPPGTRPRHPVPGSYRGPHPGGQQQPNRPFFYVQPSQPYMPCQWPMPMPYVPYGGFPGLGYGMMVPPLPPATYMEAPGYILPHAQLHMVDYRRMMAPHMAPAMAYQARRFRYQHTAPPGRVMVSSEVQTEPVCSESPERGIATSSEISSESGRSSGSELLSPRLPEDKAVYPEQGCANSFNKNIADKVATTSTLSTVPNTEILFQAEEVRIECRGTPTGLKIVHAKETAELSSNASGELLQCNMGSVHAAEDVVLRCYQPLSFEEGQQRECADDLHHSDDQYLPTCPDILMMGTCPSTGTMTSLERSDVAPAEADSYTELHSLMVQEDPTLVKGDEDMSGNTKSMHFKILRLPFDLQCLDNSRQMETSVWSVESLVPYVPSAEWMMQNGLVTPHKLALTPVLEVLAEDLAEVPLDSKQTTAEPNISPQENLQVIEMDGQDSITSLDSLPPYLPSASWLADFRNVYSGKRPPNVQEQINDLNNWLEGQLGGNYEGSQPGNVQLSVSPKSDVLRGKERSGHKTSGYSHSDQESCLAHHEHAVRMCKNCLVKRRAGDLSSSPSPNGNALKRYKVAHCHSSGDKGNRNLCSLCMLDPEKKTMCPVAASGVHGLPNPDKETTEGEVSENCLYPLLEHKKRPVDDQKRLCKKHPSRHSEKCTAFRQSKLREQNCSCDGPHSSLARDGNEHGHHIYVTRERNEENLALSEPERWGDNQRLISQKPKEKTRVGGLQLSDTESTRSGGRIRTHHRQKKSCARTPEIHRRDTRC